MAEQLYRWLIQPFEASLARYPDIQTLVFLSDSLLRNIPMATLRDPTRKRYFLEDERYATVTVPSLQLFTPQAWQQTSRTVLMAGISEVRHRRFNPLPTVIPGFQKLQNLLPGSMLLNQDFTQQALQNQVQKTAFSIVHLATHGSFSSDPDETFILTSDDLLKGADLEGLLKSATDRSVDAFRLLLLSACETAKGDHRATLGLAGIAVRSGARSTLAGG